MCSTPFETELILINVSLLKTVLELIKKQRMREIVVVTFVADRSSKLDEVNNIVCMRSCISNRLLIHDVSSHYFLF